jgi:Microsomal signal peptidase 25 kDa subunit (SPC25)
MHSSLPERHCYMHMIGNTVMKAFVNMGLGAGVRCCFDLCSILVALYAQFGPGKFPKNWWAVFACVVSYVALTLFLNWFCQKYEGDAFLVTKVRTTGQLRATRSCLAAFSLHVG